MTEIEKKALALVNEVERDFGDNSPTIRIIREDLMDEALCRAIEQHEAYKQEVSDAAEYLCRFYGVEIVKAQLERFIITKPDPLVGVFMEAQHLDADAALCLALHTREALAKRGLKIVEDV